MSPTRIGSLLALLAIAFKLVSFFYAIGGPQQGTIFAMLHLLLILLAAFISVSTSAKDADWIEMFKNGMKGVATYTVLFCIFLYVHYSNIDTMWIPERIEGIIDRYPEDQKAQVQQFFTAFATPFKYATFSLLAFMVVGSFYTFLVTVLERKVLRRFRH